jgi:cytochrome c5
MRKTTITAFSAAALALSMSAAWAAEGQGKALFESKCTLCHAAKKALSVKHDKAGWLKTVDKMRGKGAKVSEAEGESIAAYLESAAGK